MNDRKHLSGREFERLLEAVKGNRNEIRNRCLVLLMFRHGLRVSEACGLVLEQVDVESRVLRVARLKGGALDHAPAAGGRDPRHQGLAHRASADESPRSGVLSQ
jgi:type 1 fimbriae regulatory protein FimB